jgi:hypothetical protein
MVQLLAHPLPPVVDCSAALLGLLQYCPSPTLNTSHVEFLLIEKKNKKIRGGKQHC